MEIHICCMYLASALLWGLKPFYSLFCLGQDEVKETDCSQCLKEKPVSRTMKKVHVSPCTYSTDTGLLATVGWTKNRIHGINFALLHM